MAEKLELDQSIARAVSIKYPDAVYIGVSDIDSYEIFFHARGRLPTGNYTVVNRKPHHIIKTADGKYLILSDYTSQWFFLTSRDFNTPDDAKRFLGCHDDEAPTKSDPSETSVPDTPPPIPSPSPKKIRRVRFLTPWQKKTIDKLEGKNDDGSQALLERLVTLFIIGMWIFMVGLRIFDFIGNLKYRGLQKSDAPAVTYESAMSEWESTLKSEKTYSQTEQKGTVQ